MSKLLLFSDLHLREQSADTCFEVLKGIREEAVQRKIKDVGFLGDWWHLRYRVSVKLLNAVRDELQRWKEAGLHLRLLPGNHDQIDVHGRNALEVFNEMKHVYVYTDPTQDEYGMWIPYRKDLRDVVYQLERPVGCETVLYHGPVLGALMNNLHRSEIGLSAEAFKGYKAVLLGHFHKRQRWDYEGGFAQYIGSPYQTRADEAGQRKGFAIWDGQNLELIDRKWGPRYHKFEVSSAEQLLEMLHKETGPGDIVKVIAKENFKQIAQEASRIEGVSISCEPEKVENKARVVANVANTFRDHAQNYVEDTAGELNKEALMSLFDELTGARK